MLRLIVPSWQRTTIIMRKNMSEKSFPTIFFTISMSIKYLPNLTISKKRRVKIYANTRKQSSSSQKKKLYKNHCLYEIDGEKNAQNRI